jgi:predicted neuraminidase
MFAFAAFCKETHREFIYDSAPFPSCHASTVVEVVPGKLMAAWFGGQAEGAKDVAIWASLREDGRWSAPTELAREKNVPTWNPVLFKTADQKLWLYYKFGPHPTNWTGARKYSVDGGKTWSAPEKLPAGILGPVRVKPLVVDHNLVVSGTSVESYLAWASWVERSVDGGNTWSRIGPINVPLSAEGKAKIDAVKTPDNPMAADWDRTHGTIQPVILPAGGKNLLMFARATATIGYVAFSQSKDLGLTWSTMQPLTDLPNPNSGVDAIRLKDGSYVMIYNHTKNGRSPLNLARSKDGKTWQRLADLETEPGEFSYPAMILGSDGALHITYTWNRKKMRYVRFQVD